MSLTLMPGDQIIADMRYYGTHRPQREDLIVLRVPSSNTLYTKRFVAIGRDVVSLSGNKLRVNGDEVLRSLVSTGSEGPAFWPFASKVCFAATREAVRDRSLPV